MPEANPEWPWIAVRRLVILVLAALLVWQLSHVLLLLFGAILLAVLLRAVAAVIERFTPIAGRWSVGVACLILAGVLAAFFALMGAQIQAQAAALIESLPDLLETAEERLGVSGLRDWLEEQLADVLRNGEFAVSVAAYSTTVVSIAAYAVIVVASAVYLAMTPETYRQGLLKLVPPSRQAQARDTLDTIGSALKLWLLGQLFAMVLVGVLTGAGLLVLGIPSALALGFLAGILEFVPYLGPVASAVPAVALGLAESPSTALWVLGLYVLVQQIEGMLLMPLIQQRAVDLPPIVTIFAILGFGVLFGMLGWLLATPLAVVCFVLVTKLWVREGLHEEVQVPGDNGGEKGEAAE